MCLTSRLEAPGVTQALQGGQPETATTAAWPKVRLAGLRASLSWRARVSANEPWPMPNTSSPAANPVHRRRRHDRAGHVQSGHQVLGGAQA